MRRIIVIIVVNNINTGGTESKTRSMVISWVTGGQWRNRGWGHGMGYGYNVWLRMITRRGAWVLALSTSGGCQGICYSIPSGVTIVGHGVALGPEEIRRVPFTEGLVH